MDGGEWAFCERIDQGMARDPRRPLPRHRDYVRLQCQLGKGDAFRILP